MESAWRDHGGVSPELKRKNPHPGRVSETPAEWGGMQNELVCTEPLGGASY